MDILPGLSGSGMDYSSTVLRKLYDIQNKTHRSINFSFVSTDHFEGKENTSHLPRLAQLIQQRFLLGYQQYTNPVVLFCFFNCYNLYLPFWEQCFVLCWGTGRHTGSLLSSRHCQPAPCPCMAVPAQRWALQTVGAL